MACSSCGKPRMQMSRNTGAARSANQPTSGIRTVDSTTISNKVQSAVASNPNPVPKRTKV